MADGIWAYSKTEVRYRPAERDGVRCDQCRLMFPRAGLGSCKIVRGPIRGAYTCDEFVPIRTPVR